MKMLTIEHKITILKILFYVVGINLHAWAIKRIDCESWRFLGKARIADTCVIQQMCSKLVSVVCKALSVQMLFHFGARVILSFENKNYTFFIQFWNKKVVRYKSHKNKLITSLVLCSSFLCILWWHELVHKFLWHYGQCWIKINYFSAEVCKSSRETKGNKIV